MLPRFFSHVKILILWCVQAIDLCSSPVTLVLLVFHAILSRLRLLTSNIMLGRYYAIKKCANFPSSNCINYKSQHALFLRSFWPKVQRSDCIISELIPILQLWSFCGAVGMARYKTLRQKMFSRKTDFNEF